MPLPTASEKYHPGRSCGPCALCGNEKHRYTHPEDWEDNEKEILTKLSGIPLNRCVCKACTDDLKRHGQSGQYVPRWRRSKRACAVTSCTAKNSKIMNCKLLSVNEIQKVLKDKCGFNDGGECSSDGVLLCQLHYNQVYRTIPSNQERIEHKKCSACSSPMNNMEPRYCTKPHQVKLYLKEVNDLDINLTEQSVICRSCYRFFSDIINNPVSLDSNLQDLIASMEKDEELLVLTGLDSCVNYSLIHTTRRIADSLLRNEALLLSDAYQQLITTLQQTLTKILCDSTINPTSLVTKRHYHQYLVSNLQEHLECKTKEQSVGTILFRKGGDIMKALSRSLQLNYKLKSQPPQPQVEQECNSKSLLYSVCDSLNDRVHDTIDTILEGEREKPLDLSTVNIQQWISKSDKTLWETLLLITRTRQERKLSTEDVLQNNLSNVRKLRLFYILCILCFNTDSRCNIPLHTLLTDVVDTHGGTQELIQILNRFGAISSGDTHARYVDFIVKNTKHKQHNINEDFLVASLDNIDFLRSYAAVYCGDQLRSWHGTTIQVIQPKPTTSNDEYLSDLGLRRKRKAPTSPLQLPPCKKVARRSRTAAERGEQPSDISTNLPLLDQLPADPTTASHSEVMKDATPQQFQVSPSEQKCLHQFELATFKYIHQRTKDSTTPSLQQFLLQEASSNGPCTRPMSTYRYIEVLDMNADSKEAVLTSLATLHKELNIGVDLKHLVVVTDAKIFPYMHEIKNEHKGEFDWLIPYPGDFHILLNYQKVLMKVYWDAGIKQLASASGFKGATLSSLQNCSNFTNTSRFIFQVWEALYRHVYLQYQNTLVEGAGTTLQNLHTFANEKANEDDNWSFWSDFIFKNGLAFISMYMSVRSTEWGLRLASLKNMVPLFAAFDRPNYHKLLPRHIADLLQAPPEIVAALSEGGFTASLSGRFYHDVALDEAHEMLINKDMKKVISRPSKEYLQQMAGYHQHRASCLLNLTEQVLPPASEIKYKNYTKDEGNIKSMMQDILEKNLLPMSSNNTTLRNSFTGQIASGEERQHLMTFRTVGQEEYDNHVKHTYIKESSTTVVARRQRLKTFSKPKVSKQRLKTSERDKKKLSMCLKKRLEAATTSQPSSEQYLELPRALCDSNGMPNKGNKSTARDYLDNRYQSICSSTLPTDWNTECVIFDGMFMIHTMPKDGSTMRQYATMLIQRSIYHYIQRGTKQIHVVFDHSVGYSNHPKQIEHTQRYGVQTQCPFDDHFNPTDCSKANPRDWNTILQCQQCKQRLTNYLGNAFLEITPVYLQNEQRLYVAGCEIEGAFERSLYSTHQSSHIPDPSLRCNAPEADTRIWLHAMHSVNTSGLNTLIVSADTDTVFIGLTHTLSSDKIYVKINALGKPPKYMSMHTLQDALLSDPDLETIPEEQRAKIIQALFVLTGCDFTSFFSGLGKVTFFNTFMKNARFIVGTDSLAGDLTDSVFTTEGFMAFTRLIGCAYFSKHHSAFGGTQTPSSLYYSLQENGTTEYDTHCKWLSTIRDAVWQRIYFEDDLIPTIDALQRHYKRALWVINYWRQSTNNVMDLPPLQNHGYLKIGEKVMPEWDSEANIQCIKERVNFLLKGCCCKKSKCQTKQCKCFKAGRPCGPGCHCVCCYNKETAHPTDTESDDSCERIETEIVFDNIV